MAVALISFAVWIGVAFWVGKTAERKGRSPFWWVALALVLGLLTFIPLLIAGTSKKGLLEVEQERQRRLPPTSPSQIKELAELKDAGLLTTAEFDAKKTELLSRL